MKDLITTMAALTILMVFVMQFAANQVLGSRILASDKVVQNYHNLLLEEKGKAQEYKDSLKHDIALCLGCESSEVKVTETGQETVKVSIEAPLRQVIACGELLGITPEENTARYISSFQVTL